jgi:hypothetical protein
MHEPHSAPEHVSAKSVGELDGLVQNATRCYRLARRLANPVFTRQLVELGQDYASRAIAKGADPANLPAPDEWRRVRD